MTGIKKSQHCGKATLTIKTASAVQLADFLSPFSFASPDRSGFAKYTFAVIINYLPIFVNSFFKNLCFFEKDSVNRLSGFAFLIPVYRLFYIPMAFFEQFPGFFIRLARDLRL